jgi:alpha-glucosidase
MGLLLLMTLRGNVFVYQGEELGLPQAHVPFERLVDPEAIANWPQTLGRDGARTPMPWRAASPHAGFSTVEPWLPVDPVHTPLSVDVQDADPGSMLNATRRLLRLRAAHPALRTGSMTVEPTEDPLLVFTREAAGERLMAVFNLGHAPVAWTAGPGWRVVEAVNGADPASGALAPLAGLLLAETA